MTTKIEQARQVLTDLYEENLVAKMETSAQCDQQRYALLELQGLLTVMVEDLWNKGIALDQKENES